VSHVSESQITRSASHEASARHHSGDCPRVNVNGGGVFCKGWEREGAQRDLLPQSVLITVTDPGERVSLVPPPQILFAGTPPRTLNPLTENPKP
jgi:hypothetical protein